MNNNLNDPKNIAGLSNLLRDDDIDSTMDLAELEREIASGAILETNEEINVADEFRKEMDRMSRNFDIGHLPEPAQSNNNLDIYEVESPKQSKFKNSPASLDVTVINPYPVLLLNHFTRPVNLEGTVSELEDI